MSAFATAACRSFGPTFARRRRWCSTRTIGRSPSSRAPAGAGIYDNLWTSPAQGDLLGSAAGMHESVGTVRNLVCGAIVTPMEGGYGNQERHPGQFAGGA
jgi:hypothetical protein